MGDDPIRRRQFLERTVLGAGALALGPGAGRLLAGEQKKIPLRRLGRTGAKVSRLVLGTAVPLSLPYLKRAVDLGVTAFDLADCYNGGDSERIMGRFLQKTGLRKQLFLTTKSCPHDPAEALSTLDTSLERLGVDGVDNFFLHNLKTPDELTPELKQRIEALKKAGKIRFFGFSTHAPRLVQNLTQAAAVGWVDAILFKYNFRDYGDLELNKAIDACKKADVGLIAMKTQASHFSFEASVKPFEDKGFSKAQAVLKAVWEDDRIDAIVSGMKGFDQLEQNVAAAMDRTKLGAATMNELRRLGGETDHLYCRGCEQHCGPSLDRPVAVADTLRILMYHDEYQEAVKARRLFQEIPAELRDLRGVDFGPASRACPYGLDVARLMGRAADVFAV